MRKFLGMTDEIWILDAETASPVNLPERGQYIYWDHPETETLMLSARRLGGNETHLWDFKRDNDRLPRWLREKLDADPADVMFAAANCVFDKSSLQQLGFRTPDNKWLDILVIAYTLGFAGRLNDVLKQTGILQKKDPEGQRCITEFSVKRTPWREKPDLWDKFRRYCIHDAYVEEQLLAFCMHWVNTPWFSRVFKGVIYPQELVYRKINHRGLPVDFDMVRGAIAIKDQEIERITQHMASLTGLDNPNSVSQILAWARAQGYGYDDLKKDSIRDWLDVVSEDDDLTAVLRLRQEVGKSSVKKYDALSRVTMPDGRFRGGWQFLGASRTGRVAGRVLNPANLPRPVIDDPDTIAGWIRLGDAEYIRGLFPEASVLDTLSSCIRASLKAPPGQVWCVSDLTAIEAVGSAWLAGCDTVLDIFKAGRDPYKTLAATCEGIAYDDVDKDLRKLYKPVVLGGGYQLSGYGLMAYAHSMGVTLDRETADKQIADLRDAWHEIPHYWYQLKNAAINAVHNPGTPFYAYAVDACLGEQTGSYGKVWREYSYRDWPRVTYVYDKTFLFCRSPSGRFLCYYQPSVEETTIQYTDAEGNPASFTTDALFYYGVDQSTPGGLWRKISTHGGKLLENINQHICRDIMWTGLGQAEDDPDYEVVGDIYDEVLALIENSTPEENQEKLDKLNSYLCTRPAWADERFFLGSAGYVADRFKKD